MLIGRVSDGKQTKRNGEGDEQRNDYHEYETANELYNIMTKNQQFDTSDETLTAGDLVILYKNLDIGTKLITEAKFSQTKPSNQYVETVIYNDDQDSDGSEIGEIYSTEDIRNIMMINKERIDLLSNASSYETNLCQKYGNVAMNPSNLATSYNKNFLFKDTFIKDQLNSFIPETNDTNVLPTSLLDYICCKRLEDNYNFYMDSVITYVQHTIEHLKRISNGDYLTDKAKKKWREVPDPFHKDQDRNKTVLANSISIPLQVEPKFDGIKRTWDDTVHSEVDVRSLSKILEKKIILEIPKLICGTYKLFSKRYNDNLIISCKKETNYLDHESRSRVDVVLKFKKSDTGHVISKLNNIMILQTSPQTSIQDLFKPGPLPLMYEKEEETIAESPKSPKVVELNEDDEVTEENTYESSILTNKSQDIYEDSLIDTDTDISSISLRRRNHDFVDTFMLYQNVIDKTYSDEQTEANFRITSANDLSCTVQRLNMNSPVPEESEVSVKKKKSASKIRIKSPYENSSHTMDEKKRKRLLEIRERRENRKKALSDNCKISKHKYIKGGNMANASSSVTKLSITNKSFYNSIYGQTINNEGKNTKGDQKPQNGDLKIVVELESCDEDSQKKSPRLVKNKEKYINHSYYLDDADTEVMRFQMKKQPETDNTIGAYTTSSSVASDDFGSSLSLLKDLISPPLSLNNPTENIYNAQDIQQNIEILKTIVDDAEKTPLETIQSDSNIVPTNTPKDDNLDANKYSQKDCTPSVECRKSIDKIYHLMKGARKTETSQISLDKNLEPSIISDGEDKGDKDYCSIQPSDSGTSVKHHLTSSIPSCFSFEKTNNDQRLKKNITRKSEIPISVFPKVLNNSKLQTPQSHEDKQKSDRRKTVSPVTKISENPLKAISQLLHEFENVQKNRLKNGNESKLSKKLDSEHKNSRQVTFKRPLRQEHHLKNSEPLSRVSSPKDRKSRNCTTVHATRQPNTKSPVDEKQVEKSNRRKVTDILDEVKEARGEAVRGPPKSHSRLDSLAQPKKCYIQAHNEQYQNRNIRNVINRQQKMTNNSPVIERRAVLNLRQKRGSEISGSQKPHSAVPPLGSRRSSSSSPDQNHKHSPVLATELSNKPTLPEAPETLMKMVAAESFVNNYYGRSSPIRDLKNLIGAQKSRVPLIPTDLDIGSVTSSRTAEESTALGKKLHYMIDTMINTTLPALTSLHEKNESSLSKDNLNEAFVENMEQYDEPLSNTEFPIDIFEDKSITTAVASLPKDNGIDETILSSNIDFIAYDIQPFNSTTELERLENALYRRLSAATFQKRLRIKKLTLTPKHSLQQVFVLHSGDAGSMLVKSTLSQNMIKTKSKTSSEIYKPTHSKSHIDWTFANFPKQYATVGYTVPSTYKEEESQKITLDEKAKSVANHSKDSRSMTSGLQSNKTHQCSPAIPQHQERQDDVFLGSRPIGPFQMDIFKNTDETNALVKIDDNKSQESRRNSNKSEKIVTNQRESEESKLSLIPNNQFLPNKTDIDNTTSLDILVGLLNEIKNITTCQTNLTKHEANIEDNDCKELEFILKNVELQYENSVEHSPQNALSFDSLGNEQQSNLCALLRSNNSINYEPLNAIPVRLDKEVNVSISRIDYVHTFTEVPSRFLPTTAHHSTNVTSSLIGVISEPSEQSLDYQTLYCNSSYNRVIELPNDEPKRSVHSLKEIWREKETEEKINITLKNERLVNNCEFDENTSSRKKENKHYLSDFDPLLKIKRDVLVTVYSILVMTVFAALSFPEILYRS